MGTKRKNIPWIIKTFRFTIEFVEEMERVLFFARVGEQPKYKNMTKLVVTAVNELIKIERRAIEKEGVAWDHLTPGFGKSLTEQEDNNVESN